MTAPPPDDLCDLRRSAFAARHRVDEMITRWQAIDEDAARLRGLADLGAPTAGDGLAAFLAGLGSAADWQRELAWQGVEDIAAMLTAGMAALDVLARRGIAPQIPALTLWREVDAAQRSLLAMLHSEAPGLAASAASA